MTKIKNLGTMAETGVVKYLQLNGWPWAERRALRGQFDQGDVAGMPGICVEVKNARSGLRLSSWLGETERERVASNSEVGLLVVKPAGIGAQNVAEWLAVMRAPGHDTLIEQANEARGYPLVRATPATPFNQKSLIQRLDLAAGSTSRTKLLLTALTVSPPGKLLLPEWHIRVMRLRQMTHLLRWAGYGTPFPTVGETVERARAEAAHVGAEGTDENAAGAP